MKGKENLSGVDIDALLSRRAELIRDLMVARFQLRIGQLEDSSTLPKLRRSMARVNTELRSREVAGGLAKGTLLGRSVPLPQVAGIEDETESEGTGADNGSGRGFIRDTLLGKRS
jgi:ribosomal protein L29